MSTNRVLFILKRKEDYSQEDYSKSQGLATGLLNSPTFVNDMLIDEGVESKLVVVIDNNDIDREVTSYKPTHVIIEALWVVPEKFDILQKPKLQISNPKYQIICLTLISDSNNSLFTRIVAQ